jgi:alpha-tubulin suppressor-like RCC1 family protein
MAAVTLDGKLACWGNEEALCNFPADLENVVAVACGSFHSAALTQEGKVVCWGSNFLKKCEVPANLGKSGGHRLY